MKITPIRLIRLKFNLIVLRLSSWRIKEFGESLDAGVGPRYALFTLIFEPSTVRFLFPAVVGYANAPFVVSEADTGKTDAPSAPPIRTKPPAEQKKNVPDIQPSKTHKVEPQGETKKQIKGTKIVINSMVDQNAVNPSEDAGLKPTKSQVRGGEFAR